MNKHLFLFTITPVQSFVEQSRKTQDLYAGSFLLSYLCKTAGKKLDSANSAKIIFPNFDNQSNPNRFLAVVEADENAELKTIGEALQEAVEDEFKKIAKSVIDNLKVDKPNGVDEQIESYFTVNWLFLPFDEKDYKQRYAEIESLMGAIKTVRVFKQFSDSEKGRKCSICGERNVKFYRLTEKEKNANYVKRKKLFSNHVHIVEFEDYEPIILKYLQSGEGLCAVCFTKRCLEKSGLSDYNPNFPSTAKIALFGAFDKLKKKDNSIGNQIDSDNYEPQGIFALKNNKRLEDIDDFKSLPKKKVENTQKLYDALKDNDIHYSPYYAVMLFDGDNMGEWLSGDRIKKDRLKEFYEKLTRKLGEFADSVRNIIKDPMGVTVYAGGEDFLGFFNLNHLLGGMKMLRKKFDEKVNQPLKSEGFFLFDSSNMTFSAGVVIAHIKTPLSEVLNWARKMEKMAKEIDDNKDAFAIAVLKHSGEIEKTAFRWRYNGQFVTDIVSTIVSGIKSDTLSNTFIKKLNQEMLRLTDKDGKYTENHIITTELKRLLSRSCMKTKDESKGDFEKRKEEMVSKLTEWLSVILTESKNMDNFLSFLNITDFNARQIKGEVQNEN